MRHLARHRSTLIIEEGQRETAPAKDKRYRANLDARSHYGRQPSIRKGYGLGVGQEIPTLHPVSGMFRPPAWERGSKHRSIQPAAQPV